MDAPRLGSPRMPRHNALSPLQAFSPLREEPPPIHTNPRPGRPPTKTTTAQSSADSAVSSARSKSTSAMDRNKDSPRRLRRSLNGRERAFSVVRDRSRGRRDIADDSSSIITRLLLVKAPHEGLHKRSQSAASLPGMAQDTSPPRPSFVSSFAQSSSATSLPSLISGPPSPTERKHERQASLGNGRPPTRELEPQQVVDLAKGLMTSVCSEDVPTTGPKRARRKSVSGYDISNPTPDTEALALEPVEYRELPPGALLPFINRPAEVDELIFAQDAVNAMLADSLRSTLPSGPLRERWADIDAGQFRFDELRALMTEVDRPQCPDYEWVTLVRAAVRTHNAALWESLGECLGCDPELMVAGDEGILSDSSAESTPSRVFICGLPSVEPEERRAAEQAERERTSALELGGADDVTAAWSMDTIGEDEAGTPKAEDPEPKRRSWVGIQILTREMSSTPEEMSSPSSPVSAAEPSPANPSSPGKHKSPMSPRFNGGDMYERSPGNPLFPSSFSTLSVEPTLGPGRRVPSAAGFVPDARRRSQDWHAIRARLSGTGLSESAITFVSDSSLEV